MGGGQRVMIEIIISENDNNNGRPLRSEYNSTLLKSYCALIK